MSGSLLARSDSQNAATMSVEHGFYYRLDRSDMVKCVPRGARRLLDVGCGAGGFGAALKQRGEIEVWGVELNEHAAQAAASVLDEVRVGPLEEHIGELPHGYFDCIAFNDVLEHMVDPFGALKDVRELLTDDGVVVASVPNLRFYRALKHILVDGDFNYVDYGIFDRTHLRFFTKKSIVRMFNEAGYAIRTLEGIHGETPVGLAKRAGLAVLRALLPNWEDTRYLQFAVVAGKREV